MIKFKDIFIARFNLKNIEDPLPSRLFHGFLYGQQEISM